MEQGVLEEDSKQWKISWEVIQWKAFVENFLNHKQMKNTGQLDKLRLTYQSESLALPPKLSIIYKIKNIK